MRELLQHLLIVDFLMTGILTYMRLHLFVVLICISLLALLSIFSLLFGHLYVYFGEVSIQICIFLKLGCVVFLILNCMSSLYILEINHLVASFVSIFSHSVSCLCFLCFLCYAKAFKCNSVPFFFFLFYFHYSRRWLQKKYCCDLHQGGLWQCFPSKSFMVVHIIILNIY